MSEDWNSLEFVCIEPRWIANDRRISAAAARNVRRRIGRHGEYWQPCVGIRHWKRSRMNPRRTTWGKDR